MRNPIIRAIYLYLFALIGLGMLVVGASMIVDLGLKAWVFTKADEVDNYNSKPVSLYLDSDIKTVQNLDKCSDKCNLTELEREQISNWLVDYKTWQESESSRDPNTYRDRNRQRQASTAISLIFIGLPLWLFHWSVIKKDVKGGKEEDTKEV